MRINVGDEWMIEIKKNDFGCIDDYKNIYPILVEKIKDIRRLRGDYITSEDEPADYSVKYSYMNGHTAKVLAITLSPTGCEWANQGGCSMCGEWEGSRKNDIVPSSFHIAQFKNSVNRLFPEYQPSWLRIYQEGNYTNTNEMELAAQLEILRMAVQLPGLERITIESRPNYLTESVLVKFAEVMKGSSIELEIGMGYEAENDIVRNICINKGEQIQDYISAIEKLHDYGVRALAYVILKPPFLTEGEAITEAVRTIYSAQKLGFDSISLEPMSVHKYSLVHALYVKGLYDVPWLWSVIEVIKHTYVKVNDLRIGGVGFFPRPKTVTHNHHENNNCNKHAWEAIGLYNKERIVDELFELDCECKHTWASECANEGDSLKTRIAYQLEQVDVNEYQMIGLAQENEPVVENTTAIAGGTQKRLI